MWDFFAYFGIAVIVVLAVGSLAIGILYLWAKAMGMPD